MLDSFSYDTKATLKSHFCEEKVKISSYRDTPLLQASSHDVTKYHHIIIGFLINVQVQGHHPHQWAPFQVTG